jgi:hypothetical protein
MNNKNCGRRLHLKILNPQVSDKGNYLNYPPIPENFQHNA